MSKFPTTLASVLHVVASGLFSIHFTFLACCDDLFLCSKLKKKRLSSNQHPWPFGPVWSPAKCETWWDCWFPGFALAMLSQKYWIFGLSGSCQIKRSTYFLVVRKTSLQIRWVRSGWWLHACSQCWRTVKDDILELANTSWNPISAWRFHMDSALTPDPVDSPARPICQAVHSINICHGDTSQEGGEMVQNTDCVE